MEVVSHEAARLSIVPDSPSLVHHQAATSQQILQHCPERERERVAKVERV